MQTDKQVLGRLGEDLAADYLEKNGYTVVGRNLHFSKNELDIVAEDDDFIVFVEVKTRSCLYPESNGYGTPGRAVDHKKRGNTIKAVKDYLLKNYVSKQPRIDVIEVYLLESQSEFKTPTVLKINHIRNAFDARGRKLH
ncbi:MAG: YraN family protein [Ruminococcaceae bacterium]|nr:YraN family protein [Oscillospiraceae bacterium]